MTIQPNAEQRESLAKHYKMLLEKAAEARLTAGRDSTDYAVAVACLTSTASAVQACFLFDSAKDAHTYLRGISNS